MTTKEAGHESAWAWIVEVLKEHNPNLMNGHGSGVGHAVREIKRLQALDRPKTTNDRLEQYLEEQHEATDALWNEGHVLRKELTECRADKARLDWLERTKLNRSDWTIKLGAEDMETTVRDVIDAAMKESPNTRNRTSG